MLQWGREGRKEMSVERQWAQTGKEVGGKPIHSKVLVRESGAQRYPKKQLLDLSDMSEIVFQSLM